MRIVVTNIAASTGGALSVLRDFYKYVCENDKENEWIFLLNDRYFDETDNVKIIVRSDVKKSKWRKLLFDFVVGRKFIQRLSPDVVFSMQNIITFGLDVPQVVYIHQPLPFQSTKCFSFFRKEERKMAIIQHLVGRVVKMSARKSDRVIVQTQWMKEAVCRKSQIPSDKVFANLPTVKIAASPYLISFDKTSFFYPTSNVIYKNNDCIKKASQILEERKIEHTIKLTLPKEKSYGNVICMGRLPYDKVMAQYQCSTLIFPSYIETFGYPLAEAREMGAIVLASDTPFSREVLNGYENAYYFNPFKPEELAELMEKVVLGELKKIPTKTVHEAKDNWEQVIQWVLQIKK